jgi:hypothetical protein
MMSHSSDRGAALIAALMITALIGALVASLVFVVVTESRIGRNQQAAESGGYAAAAGVERLIGELRRLPAWQLVPSARSAVPSFNDGQMTPRLADGTTLDLARLTVDRQARSDAFYPDGVSRPQWTLYAHASLSRMTADDSWWPTPYVVVWVADDPDDGDGDASRDANGVLLVRAEAFNVRGAWRAVEATLAASIVRDGAGVPIASSVAVVAWSEAR